MSVYTTLRDRPRRLWAAGLIATGLASGVVLGSTMTAGASTTSSTTAAAAATAPVAPSTTPAAGGAQAGGYQVPGKSGTVTAVGASSVTIDGTAYAVTSSSDIDKNGEASLSSLAVGDKVTFSTDTSAATPTIDKLHAGSEALDRPGGDGGHGPGDGPGAPVPGSSGSGSASAAA